MSSDSDKIKSALDIAMEKADRLGSFSEEEKQRLKEEELAAAGEALAKRCLGGLPLRDVEAELAGRDEEYRGTIIRHLLAGLADAIDITQGGGSDRALAAIEHFSGDREAVQGIRALFGEYLAAVDGASHGNLDPMVEGKKRELESKGISGSAVKPATETSPEWLRMKEGLEAEYQDRLAGIKARWTSGSP